MVRSLVNKAIFSCHKSDIHLDTARNSVDSCVQEVLFFILPRILTAPDLSSSALIGTSIEWLF